MGAPSCNAGRPQDLGVTPLQYRHGRLTALDEFCKSFSQPTHVSHSSRSGGEEEDDPSRGSPPNQTEKTTFLAIGGLQAWACATLNWAGLIQLTGLSLIVLVMAERRVKSWEGTILATGFS